jgi:uncharacterized protein (UPF0303 family)
MNLDQELQQVANQEATLIFPEFDALTAWEIGVAIRGKALERSVAVTIDIRRGEEILFFYAMQGTTPSNADWARRKRNVVELLRRSSYAVGLNCSIKGESLEDQMGLPKRDFACHGGCFPIRVTAAGHIGTITVSGLPQREDHNLVVEVITDWLKKYTSGSGRS